MAEHSYTPIVGRADMLKTQSDTKERASSTLETPQQIIFGAAADLGEEVANMMHTLHSIRRYIRRVRKKTNQPHPLPTDRETLENMKICQNISLNKYLCFPKRDMSESELSLGAWSTERFVLQSDLSLADRSLGERSSWALCPERIVRGRSVSGRTVRIPLKTQTHIVRTEGDRKLMYHDNRRCFGAEPGWCHSYSANRQSVSSVCRLLMIKIQKNITSLLRSFMHGCKKTLSFNSDVSV